MSTVLDDELRNRNIFIDNGVSGVYLLLSALQKRFPKEDIQRWMTKIIAKIESSNILTLVEHDPSYLSHYRGLLSGFSGVLMVLAHAKSKDTQA
jgi:hypothetical protein